MKVACASEGISSTSGCCASYSRRCIRFSAPLDPSVDRPFEWRHLNSSSCPCRKRISLSVLRLRSLVVFSRYLYIFDIALFHFFTSLFLLSYASRSTTSTLCCTCASRSRFPFIRTLSDPTSPALSSIFNVTGLWSLEFSLNTKLFSTCMVHWYSDPTGTYHLSSLDCVKPLRVLPPRVVSISSPSCSRRSSTSPQASTTSPSVLAPALSYASGFLLTTSSVGSGTQLKSPHSSEFIPTWCLRTLSKNLSLAAPFAGA